MRIANVDQRLHAEINGRLVDVQTSSGGRFSSEPQLCYERWPELRSWVDQQVSRGEESGDLPPVQGLFGPPAPSPRQVFAIALNYRKHVEEAGRATPTIPGVFTKFPTCLVGPYATVELPTDTVDWEVELVVVIGQPARDVPIGRAWDYVAGLTVGQDISERVLQLGTPFPQLSMAKSMPGFGPVGPVLVTPDEFPDPDDLAIECELNGVIQQSSRTSDLIFGVPELISWMSHLVPLCPGDLIFTGTPGGIGATRNPPVYLRDGDILVSRIEGIGELRNELRMKVGAQPIH
jgi:2-keto-4-pentenoate hydratase/2-oxohepta-3-ene-1,7-dioic acid hydratase in catechol pathway